MTNEQAEIVAAHLAAAILAPPDHGEVAMEVAIEDAVYTYANILKALKARYVAPDAPDAPYAPDDVDQYRVTQ